MTDKIVAKNKPIKDGRYLTNHKINEILEIKIDINHKNENIKGIILRDGAKIKAKSVI